MSRLAAETTARQRDPNRTGKEKRLAPPALSHSTGAAASIAVTLAEPFNTIAPNKGDFTPRIRLKPFDE
jgi:hypothetical protein